jgi:hypothetical protein
MASVTSDRASVVPQQPSYNPSLSNLSIRVELLPGFKFTGKMVKKNKFTGKIGKKR